LNWWHGCSTHLPLALAFAPVLVIIFVCFADAKQFLSLIPNVSQR
jgi:hypothetical protein